MPEPQGSIGDCVMYMRQYNVAFINQPCTLGAAVYHQAPPSQQTHNVAIMSLQCRCNIVTLQRRRNDVPAALCNCRAGSNVLYVTKLTIKKKKKKKKKKKQNKKKNPKKNQTKNNNNKKKKKKKKNTKKKKTSHLSCLQKQLFTIFSKQNYIYVFEPSGACK